MSKNRKKYANIRWRVDSSGSLYVYNENDLLFIRVECFDYDEKSVADIITEEYGNDWCFAYESTDDEDTVDDASDEPENEDIDNSLSDGIPETSALGDGIFELPDGKEDS